jgi:peroxiredoxin
MAPISVGDSLPDGQLGWFDENNQLQQLSIHSLAAGKKVILFGVPGAFTPTCRSGSHLLPSYFLGDLLDSCESGCGSVVGVGVGVLTLFLVLIVLMRVRTRRP